MNQLKRISVAILGLSLLFFGQSTAGHSASIPDEQWNVPLNAPGQDGAELLAFKIAGAATGLNQPSYLAGDTSGQGLRQNMQLCTSDTDAFCASATRVEYNAYLPPCDSQITINCIVGVSAIGANGQEIAGQYLQGFPVKNPNDYPGNSARNLPVGSVPSEWRIPGVTHGGNTDTYLLRFDLSGEARSQGNFHSNSIDVSLFPMTVKTGNYTLGNMTDVNHPSGGCINDHYECGRLGAEHSGNDESLSSACVSFDVGLCALRQAFPDGYQFKVSARLGDSPTGWFHGRFFSPQITLNAANGQTNLVVTANPVKVPAVGTIIKQADMSAEMKSYYQKYPIGGGFGRLSANGISNLADFPTPSQQNVFEAYSVWSKVLNDKASATQSEWSFKTLDLNGQGNACFRDSTKLVGIVATNAMMYSGGAPALNKAEGTLDYKVGAPHYDSSGAVFKGSYDLQLRSDVARCLYNFTNAPIRATVSIASDNGDSNVATTIVTEDPSTGWLRMSASNFMFSNPTIKVTLSQDKSTSPASPKAPIAVPSKTASKQITITCAKGKTSKKVTGVKPVCPKGYVKK